MSWLTGWDNRCPEGLHPSRYLPSFIVDILYWPQTGYILTCDDNRQNVFFVIYNSILDMFTRQVTWSEWALAVAIRVIGTLYFVVLVYFLVQHYLVWKREKERVRRAVATFRVLALITLGTTYYLYRYIQEYHPMDLDSPDLTAPSMMYATVQNTFLSKLTKLFIMCLLLLLAITRMLRRL